VGYLFCRCFNSLRSEWSCQSTQGPLLKGCFGSCHSPCRLPKTISCCRRVTRESYEALRNFAYSEEKKSKILSSSRISKLTFELRLEIHSRCKRCLPTAPEASFLFPTPSTLRTTAFPPQPSTFNLFTAISLSSEPLDLDKPFSHPLIKLLDTDLLQLQHQFVNLRRVRWPLRFISRLNSSFKSSNL
jgi:hypothetical protein